MRTLRGCDSRGGRALSEHHLDRRAGELIAIGAGDPNEICSTTKDVAAWFGMSVITLEIWRSKGKGPPFTKLTPRMIRYRRGDALRLARQAHMHLDRQISETDILKMLRHVHDI